MFSAISDNVTEPDSRYPPVTGVSVSIGAKPCTTIEPLAIPMSSVTRASTSSVEPSKINAPSAGTTLSIAGGAASTIRETTVDCVAIFPFTSVAVTSIVTPAPTGSNGTKASASQISGAPATCVTSCEMPSTVTTTLSTATLSVAETSMSSVAFWAIPAPTVGVTRATAGRIKSSSIATACSTPNLLAPFKPTVRVRRFSDDPADIGATRRRSPRSASKDCTGPPFAKTSARVGTGPAANAIV